MGRFLRNNKKIYENSAKKNKSIDIDSKGIIIGSLEENNSKIISLVKDSNINKNTIVLGASGTGKTRSFVIPNILQSISQGDSMVITDFKQDIYCKTIEFFKEAGYKVKRLNLNSLLHKLLNTTYSIKESLKDIEELLLQEEFELELPGKERCTYFIEANNVSNREIKVLASDIITVLLEKLLKFSVTIESNNINFILDDFELMEKIPILFLFRSKKISVNVIFQSIRQFQKVYGKYEWINILDNCDNFLCFGDTDAETINLVNRLRIKDDEELNLNYIKKNEAVLILRNGTAVKVKKINLDLIINTKTLK